MRCYMQAQKYDPENFNVVRDLSYLQLYLRQYNSFLETSRKGMEMRANMMINWETYAFANYLTGNYDFAFKLLDSCLKIGSTSLKPNEKHEILLFQASLLHKQGKSEEALRFLLDNEKDMSLDKTSLYEKIVSQALLLGKKEQAIEYLNRLFFINSEKADYFIQYLNAKHNVDLKSFEEILKYVKKDQKSAQELLQTIQEDLKPRIKSRIINRLELALSWGDNFKNIFCLYFLQNVKQNIPSVFINVKFLYLYQEEKIPIIDSILNCHLDSIKNKGQLEPSLINNEELDIVPNFIWVYYYAAQHYDFLRDCEKALTYVDLAIDSTPSVVEFFTLKSKILSHCGMGDLSAKSYEKAKKLDLGDRYLNAGYAKIFVRLGDVKKSVEIMKEFVRDPLTDENTDHFQCMWYELECGYAYLNSFQILKAHRLFKCILGHFNTLLEDQFDFYNYCLRRFMINDFASTIEYMDRILDKDYVYKCLFAYELLLQYLKKNNNSQTENMLKTEYEEMLKEKLEKYKFKDLQTMIKDIDNDIYQFCLKLQAFSKIPKLHHMAVKSFLGREKIVLALKSLLFLEQNYPNTFLHLDALKIFNAYTQENHGKITGTYIETLIQEKLKIKIPEEGLKHLMYQNPISAILMEAYDSVFNSKSPLESTLEKIIEHDRKTLRNIKFDVYKKLF